MKHGVHTTGPKLGIENGTHSPAVEQIDRRCLFIYLFIYLFILNPCLSSVKAKPYVRHYIHSDLALCLSIWLSISALASYVLSWEGASCQVGGMK